MFCHKDHKQRDSLQSEISHFTNFHQALGLSPDAQNEHVANKVIHFNAVIHQPGVQKEYLSQQLRWQNTNVEEPRNIRVLTPSERTENAWYERCWQRVMSVFIHKHIHTFCIVLVITVAITSLAQSRCKRKEGSIYEVKPMTHMQLDSLNV